MFPSARTHARTHEPDIGKRNQGINYRVLVTPHERYWVSHICAQTSEVSREGGGLLVVPSHIFLPRILWASALTLGAIFQASPGGLTRKSGEKRRRVGNGPGSRWTTRRGEERRFRRSLVLSAFPLAVLRRRHRTLGNPAPI
jgi:hypothetical protein